MDLLYRVLFRIAPDDEPRLWSPTYYDIEDAIDAARSLTHEGVACASWIVRVSNEGQGEVLMPVFKRESA